MAAIGRGPADRAAARAGRRLALEALFEAEFGQRTPMAALERHIAATATSPQAEQTARTIMAAVAAQRHEIDARIEAVAPAYPVVQLGRIDRTLLRCALGEMLHSATPTRVVIAEWVALARLYSGEPARRLVNGVLGRIAREAGIGQSKERSEIGAPGSPTLRREQGGRLDVRTPQEDRRRTARGR